MLKSYDKCAEPMTSEKRVDHKVLSVPCWGLLWGVCKVTEGFWQVGDTIKSFAFYKDQFGCSLENGLGPGKTETMDTFRKWM